MNWKSRKSFVVWAVVALLLCLCALRIIGPIAYFYSIGIFTPQDPIQTVGDLRRRLARTQNVAALQAWALKKIETGSSDFRDIPAGLPAIYTSMKLDGTVKFVEVVFTSHFGTYGVAVGAEDWTPTKGLFYYFERWRPGVFVFADRS